MLVANISAFLDEFIAVPQPFRNVAARLLGLGQLESFYGSRQKTAAGRPIAEEILERLAVTVRASDLDLDQIPRRGATIVVANHPFGILEGAVMATVLTRIRSDVRFLANQLLGAAPGLRDLVIPIDVTGRGATVANSASLRRAIEFLEGGGCLVIFPAGKVSHYQVRRRMITDSTWQSTAARLVKTLWNRGVAVSSVPIYVEGRNSLLFQTLGMIHPLLRTALLPRELLNKKRARVELRIGSVISHKKLLEIPTAEERIEYLRWRTYLLAERHTYKPATSVPMPNSDRATAAQPVRAAVAPSDLVADIEGLLPDQLLHQTGNLRVYLADARTIPKVLEEIGRLRELTFRTAGEGTGRATDLDRFDETYLHLFVWNAARNEVVGAYRLAGTDVTPDLYTATLFRYKDEFLKQLGPALELGRSFIRAEYQRGFAPLLALWKGIGAYVAQNPRYRFLFGPVSISNQYQAVSRELMVAFLERNAPLRSLAALVSNRNPFRRSRKAVLPQSDFNLEDLSDCVSDLEPTRIGVPVLLRQYLKLGGKLLGFNVDPAFSNALDGLILVDLTKTEPKLLERYLGKRE